MKSVILVLTAAIFGAVGSWLILPYFSAVSGPQMEAGSPAQPLYWVAPMDPNFRKNEPGLSPMGMALVPVYDESTADESPGTVTISAAVESQIGVTTTKVQRLPWIDQHQAFAEVMINPQQQWQVQLRADGWIEKSYVFSVGEEVKAGQALFDFYSPTLVVAQEEFLVALADGEKNLLRSARERLQALNLPGWWIDQLQKRKKVQQRVRFIAEKKGVISALNLVEGQAIKAGSEVLTLVDLSSLWLSVHLPPGLVDIFAGKAAVQIAAKDAANRPLLLNMESAVLYPMLNQRRSQIWQFTLDNQQGDWQPGEYLTVTISQQGNAVLQLPLQAIIDDGIQPRVVLALGEGRFKSVAVNTGRSSSAGGNGFNQQSEILAGLTEGDRVVTSAQFLLDSESSINSDLLRFYPLQENSEEFTWLEGKIKPRQNGRVSVRHQGSESWQWPAMEQNFHLALPAETSPGITHKSGGVDTTSDGWSQKVRMRIAALDDGDFCIVDVQPIQTSGDNMEREYDR